MGQVCCVGCGFVRVVLVVSKPLSLFSCSAFHEEDSSMSLTSTSDSSAIANITDKTAKLDNSLRKVDSTNRKATIVIEHIIQASDVAHTVSWIIVL